ncbi:MAG TPA: DUF2844 domain-containing protein [Candidatus Acidoferrales bacterium]|nr:DUF2844 domain-containing protein [Candidatus Acidoferrales bacterium]
MDFVVNIPGLRACFLFVLGMSLSTVAYASLGDSFSSVQADQSHMKASIRSTQQDGYIVHELQSQSGVRVREYVSPEGKVFAVSWDGPFMPDLRQVLGSYFDQFSHAAQSRRARGGPLIINEPGLVVESGGHMRSFFGRAYVPQMVPANVRTESIR